MKNTNLIYKLIILVLLILNIFILYNCYQYKTKNSITTNNNTNDIKNNSNSPSDTVLLNDIFNVAAQSDGMKVNKFMSLSSISGKNISLQKLLNEEPKLIFDFTHISCKTCFGEEMLRILDFSEIIGKNKVIFVSEFQSEREQYVLEKKYNINIYNKNNKEFGLLIEKKYYPFIFVIDTNYTAQGIYVPTTQFYSLGNIYYNIIYDKYFKK